MRLKGHWRPEDEWAEPRTSSRLKNFVFSGNFIQQHFSRHYGEGEMAFERFADEHIQRIAPGSRLTSVMCALDQNAWYVRCENPDFPEVPPFNVLEEIIVDLYPPHQ